MTRSRIALVLVGLTIGTAFAGLQADAFLIPEKIALATSAPARSIWGTQLGLMSQEWRNATGGRLTVLLQTDSKAGAECDVAKGVRRGSRPEAAALTTGLSCLDPGFSLFGMPFFFQSADEALAVAHALEAEFSRRLARQNITFLGWGYGGWIHIFSRDPIANVDQLKAARLFTTAGSSAMEVWYRENGFRPVPVGLPDVPTQLMSGGVTAMPAPPIAAAAFQYHRYAPHMLNLRLSPLIGAVVINTDIWNQIPPDAQAKMRAAAEAVGRRLQADVPSQEVEAVTEMRAVGLEVIQPEPGVQQAADALVATMRGSWVPEDIYDRALAARTAFRQGR